MLELTLLLDLESAASSSVMVNRAIRSANRSQCAPAAYRGFALIVAQIAASRPLRRYFYPPADSNFYLLVSMADFAGLHVVPQTLH